MKTGDLVKKGQLLLELDGRVQQGDVELAKATVQVATALLELREANRKRAKILFEIFERY